MDRLQLAEKVMPFCEPDRVCLMDGSKKIGWLYNGDQCRAAFEHWKAGTLPSVSAFSTKTKDGKPYAINHPTRLGIVPHRDNNVFFFALDFDAHEEQVPNLYLEPKIAKFFAARPVLFRSKSGQGLRAIYSIAEPIDILEFVALIRSWGFNRTGRIELFPKTDKLTQFWLPNDPNPDTGGDVYLDGTWDGAVAALPPKIPVHLTNATLDFLLGLVEPGSRHNTLYAAAREMGRKQIERELSLKFILNGAALCGLGKGEAEQTAKDGYSQGLTDEVNPRGVNKIDGTPEISFTDTWNAYFLAKNFGNDIRFDHTRGVWMIWNGARWIIDEKDIVVEYAKESAKKIIEIAQNYIANPDYYKKILNHHIKSLSRNGIAACLVLAQSLEQIATITAEFDADPLLFNCSNGTIDLLTGEFKPHNRSNLISKISPIRYNKAAKPIAWLDNLNLVFSGKSEIISFVKRLMGLCLSGEVFEQILIFFFGGGKNGKSLFISTMEMILGGYLIRCPANMLMANKNDGVPNDIARLPGIRMAVCSELNEGMRLNESLVKDLTGNDTITARFLHQEFFDFKPSHKLLICGNSKPRVIGIDTGIWRRIVLIPFTVEIPENSRKPMVEMLSIFKSEASGILNWLLEGYLAYKEGGLQIPPEVIAATAQYRSASDVVGCYLSENCETSASLSIGIGELYTDYKDWAKESGEYALSKRRFGEQINDRGFKKNRGTGGTWLWEGLRLKGSGFQ